MKNFFSIVTVLTVLIAAPVFASDGFVPQASLDALGLSGMETLSDDEGMQVRGLSSNAASMGQSIIVGLLVDPATKGFIFGSDVNSSMASAENAGLNALSAANHVQASGLDLQLNITTLTSMFAGRLIGVAGGAGTASGN